MSFFDSLDRFVRDLQKTLKPEEILKLQSCKNCVYYKKGYCTQTSTPTKILTEYYAQGCIYFTTEEPIGNVDLSSLAEDIAAMKTMLASVGVIRTAQLLEKKGGGASLDTYSSDAEVNTVSATYVLLREFDLSTPTPPTGVTVYKYALMVSVELKGGFDPWTMSCRIDVDDEILATISEALSSYTWFDRAKEVTQGSHNVKIYLKQVGVTAFLKGTRGTCGIGTIGTSETKVAEIQTSGEGKGSFEIVGKAFEDPVTVSGILKADESETDKAVLEVEVTDDGAEYSDFAGLETMLYQALIFYGITTSGGVACFLDWFESSFLMSAAAP